jgi:hypothetical protein
LGVFDPQTNLFNQVITMTMAGKSQDAKLKIRIEQNINNHSMDVT